MTADLQLSRDQRRDLGLPVDRTPDPIAGWRSTRARLLAWQWRHRQTLAVAVPLLAVAVALRWWGVAHSPALSDDEGTYVAQAWAVQARHALSPYTYWYDHPPLGWLQLSAYTWVGGVFGGHGLSVVAVRRLMVGYAGIDTGLLFLLARRLTLPRWAAALATALWALSPLAVGYSRMVYLDNIAMPWALAAFALAATRRRSMWAQVGAGLCFAMAVLSKETMLLLLPGLLLIVWQHTDRRTRSFCLVGFGATTLLALAAYPLLAVLKGELLPGPGHVSLVQALRFQLSTRPSTGSPLSAGTGSRTVLDGWLALDRWLLLSGLLAAPFCLWRRQLRPVGLTVAVLVLVALRPGYLPTPYVIALLPFAALAVGGGAATLYAHITQRAPAAGRRTEQRVAAAALAVALAATGSWLVSGWIHTNAAQARTDQNAAVLQAEHWLETHRTATATTGPGDVLVDDTVWADLVTHGFPAARVIWFYKLDFVANLDPSVRREIQSYRDFGLVLSTPTIRTQLADGGPQTYAIVRQALAHSRVVASFGSGAGRVEVRAIESTDTTSGTTGRSSS